MDRRSFVSLLARVGAALGLSPLLPQLSAPAPAPPTLLLDEVNALTRQHLAPALVDNYFARSPLMGRIKERS